MDSTDDLDRDLRALGVDLADLAPGVLDALRDARQPAHPEPEPDPVRSWLRGLFSDPDAVTAAAADQPPPPGNRVRSEGGNAPPRRTDERTAFVRELFGLDPDTGHYR
jgi:hypothetical protein